MSFVCKSQECTNCSSRKECSIRKKFYNKEHFEKLCKDIICVGGLLNVDTEFALYIRDDEIKQMHIRRDKELELHPNYSD